MTVLSVKSVSVELNGYSLLKKTDFSLAPGELVAIIGPNGAGKSTLIKSLAGAIAVSSGDISIDSKSLSKISITERARLLSYLPQERDIAWPITVRDIVALGRYAFGAAPDHLSEQDAVAIERALSLTNLLHLAHRPSNELSGGELSRVHLARSFASGAPILLADEPTTALDLKHQWETLDHLSSYVQSGNTAAIILHDIQLAARFATRICLMNDGEIVEDGSPEDVLTQRRIQDLFGIDTSIVHRDGYVDIIPLGLA